MKIGDRVRVVKLEVTDKECTDLKKGDIGTVVNIDGIVYYIRFHRVIEHNEYNWDANNNSYGMYKWQLEVVQESELDELEKYKAIGTVEECSVAVEKQKKKKPNDIKNSVIGIMYGYCPTCRRQINVKSSESYCIDCGQKLDWESEGEK